MRVRKRSVAAPVQPKWMTELVDWYKGDCRKVLRSFPDNHFFGCVTDPPYGLSKEPDVAVVMQHWLRSEYYQHKGKGFMGKEWDTFVPGPDYWLEMYRVLRPGAYLLVFAGTRTHDLMSMAIRLAGFVLRDTIQYNYGTGFPKSLDVSKGLDKAAGAEREVVGYDASKARPNKENFAKRIDRQPSAGAVEGWKDNGATVTAPATDAARTWDGYGTALKPAYEPILVFRKPVEGTVVENVQRYGTGGMNIDGCRMGITEEERDQIDNRSGVGFGTGNTVGKNQGRATGVFKSHKAGRWPANVILQHHEDCQPAGTKTVAGRQINRWKDGSKPFGGGAGHPYQSEQMPDDAVQQWECHADCPVRLLNEQADGVSRFFKVFPPTIHDEGERMFYMAKAGKKERNAGVSGTNTHPTVKPIALMRYLLTLVTPPGDPIMLDPFAGSGSTLCAAVQNGTRIVGIDLDGDPDVNCTKIARQRVRHWASIRP